MTDLQCEDFAGELLAIPPQSVTTVTVTAEKPRVGSYHKQFMASSDRG